MTATDQAMTSQVSSHDDVMEPHRLHRAPASSRRVKLTVGDRSRSTSPTTGPGENKPSVDSRTSTRPPHDRPTLLGEDAAYRPDRMLSPTRSATQAWAGSRAWRTDGRCGRRFVPDASRTDRRLHCDLDVHRGSVDGRRTAYRGLTADIT